MVRVVWTCITTAAFSRRILGRRSPGKASRRQTSAWRIRHTKGQELPSSGQTNMLSTAIAQKMHRQNTNEYIRCSSDQSRLSKAPTGKSQDKWTWTTERTSLRTVRRSVVNERSGFGSKRLQKRRGPHLPQPMRFHRQVGQDWWRASLIWWVVAVRLWRSRLLVKEDLDCSAPSGFFRYPTENRTCYQCGQKGHLSANCTEGSIKDEGAGETQPRLRLQSSMGSIPQHELQEENVRPEDSANQVGTHQFVGTMSSLGVSGPGRARKKLPSPPPAPSAPFERFPSFAKIQARDTATTARDTDTGHAASTAATAQAAGEVLTGASIRCGYEFRCCCKFCRKARAYEVEDASKEPACSKAHWGCSQPTERIGWEGDSAEAENTEPKEGGRGDGKERSAAGRLV